MTIILKAQKVTKTNFLCKSLIWLNSVICIEYKTLIFILNNIVEKLPKYLYVQIKFNSPLVVDILNSTS